MWCKQNTNIKIPVGQNQLTIKKQTKKRLVKVKKRW